VAQLVLRELRDAATALAADDLRLALKRLARVKHIQRTPDPAVVGPANPAREP
jgi:tryptophan 2,3-dioxygenase